MKRNIKFIALLLFISIMFTSLTACSINDLFGNNSSTSIKVNKPNTQTITVYNGNTPTTYTVKLGEVAKIGTFTRPGYYFVGAYDSENGGVKYFDGNGNSTMVWGSGNPDTYYVRFESIYNISYSKILREENPYKWDGTKTIYMSFPFTDNLKNAISANRDKNLTVKLSIDLSCDDSWEFKFIQFRTLKNGGETYELANNLQLKGGTYKTYTYSATIPARLLQSGEIFVFVKGLDLNILELAHYYYKNVKVSISFEKNI